MTVRSELDAAWASWQTAELYKKWRKSNPGEASKLDAYRAGGARPALVTATGTALVCETAAWLASAPVVDPPPSGTVYVSKSGSDTSGNGTQKAPWLTVRKATSTVTSGTISVGAGTFQETTTLDLPNGVSLVGSGQGQTVIQSITTPLLRVQNTTAAQTISDLSLDGRSHATAQGIYVENSRYLTVTRVTAYNFSAPADHTGGAINVESATDLTISHCILTDSGKYLNPYYSGTLGLGNLLRAQIHHNTVSDSIGYAIKSTGGHVTDSDIYSNAFSIPWPNRSNFALCVEFFGTAALNSTFRNNTIDGPLSLTGPTENPAIVDGYRWRIHNNHWTIGGSYGGGGYAVECSVWSCEFDHNLVEGGIYSLAQFENKNVTDWHVHHNVFDNQISPTFVGNYAGGTTAMMWDNNTVICRSSPSDGIFKVFNGTGLGTIRDSIFYATSSIGDKLGPGLGSMTIDNNVFHNITVPAYSDTNSAFANPGIPLAGSWPAKYTPSSYTSKGAFADGAFPVGIAA